MAYNFGCRPPPGGRGLKSQALYRAESVLSSSSTRGTWIEMTNVVKTGVLPRSSSTRGTWIEIL